NRGRGRGGGDQAAPGQRDRRRRPGPRHSSPLRASARVARVARPSLETDMSDYPRRVLDRPRVLAVTGEAPWPLDSGGHLRTFHLLRALHQATDLRLVLPVLLDRRGPAAELAAQGFWVRDVLVGPRTARGELRQMYRSVRSREPYMMYRRHFWPAAQAAFAEELKTFRPAVVYLDHLDSAQHLDAIPESGVPTILDMHNVYSTLVDRMAAERWNPLTRVLYRREARALDRVERRTVLEVTAVTAVSEIEAQHFQNIGARSVYVVPNGVDCDSFADMPVGREGSAPIVLFLGTMSWGPNASAARFLADVVCPNIRQRVPATRLLIVGRDPPADVRELAERPGIEVIGNVPDVRPYLRQASVMAVPLDAGGGTRLKILEAFAAGLPVVSTAVGAEGIEA